uniref:Phospholipase-like protein n=1 Tax=Tanacetum cinerariifolium TaxID=118510 RepID=A0A6L2MSP4_TANCI|nr:phospholipase-like protein [Tanacetum cinerariifolium]
MCRLEEHKMMKALFLKTLQEEVQRRDEKEKLLKYEEDKKKIRHELGNTFAMAEKDRPLNFLNDQDMNLFLKDVTPWVEDISRYNRATDRVHLTNTFDIFLGRQGPRRCRFPWCKDVSVDRRFWESLMCLNPTKKGWIIDEHVELLVNYLWNFRPHDADWAMVGGLSNTRRIKVETKRGKMCRLEEHKMMKALFLKTLQEEVQRRDEKEKLLKYEEDKKKIRHELGNTFAMAEKDRPLNFLNDQDMNLFLKDVTPWVEDISRYNRATDRVHLTNTFDIFLGRQGPRRCRFPWCKDVSVDRRFWESLMCLNPTKKGWIIDEHVELLVNYLWNFRPHDADWAMVGGYFV